MTHAPSMLLLLIVSSAALPEGQADIFQIFYDRLMSWFPFLKEETESEGNNNATEPSQVSLTTPSTSTGGPGISSGIQEKASESPVVRVTNSSTTDPSLTILGSNSSTTDPSLTSPGSNSSTTDPSLTSPSSNSSTTDASLTSPSGNSSTTDPSLTSPGTNSNETDASTTTPKGVCVKCYLRPIIHNNTSEEQNRHNLSTTASP